MKILNHSLILITGASSGIGAATALAFGERKVNLALIGRNTERLNTLMSQIHAKSNAKVKIYPFDLANLNQIPKLVHQIENDFQSDIQVLINSAGMSSLGYVEEVPLQEFQNNLNINFLAMTALIQSIAPTMKKARKGSIVNLLSGASIRGLPGASPYCVSKFAAAALTESLRVELKPFNIEVLSISPGPTETPLLQNQRIFGALHEKFISKHLKSPDEVAVAILKAIEKGIRHLDMSLNSKIARHLNYWSPRLLDVLLGKKMKRKLEAPYQPQRVIDVHAYYDESRISIPQYLQLMDKYHVQQVVLSAPCTHVHEPNKSPLMYWVQRLLLKSGLLRPIAGLIALSFYDSEGRLRPFWKSFTKDGQALNKVMHPDNDNLERLIKMDPQRFKMWLWINPKNSPSLDAVRVQLSNPQVFGIKFHAYWHGFDLKTLQPYMDLSLKLGKPVYIILGFGISGNYQYLLDTYPKNQIIFGYGGFPFFKKVWTAIQNRPEKYIDFTSFHLDPGMVQGALKILGTEKCLYGSDCPYNFSDPLGQFNYLLTYDRIISEKYTPEQLNSVFYSNFEHLASKS